MPEVCPRSGLACPVDKNLNSIKLKFEGDRVALELLSLIKDAVEIRRANAPCDGVVTDQDERQHCGSQARAEIQGVATLRGGAYDFEPGTFSELTVSEIR